MMGVSRSGYYKWKKRGDTERGDKRTMVIELVSEIHKSHPSHGYRWVCAYISANKGVSFTPNYVYKAFRYLGIQAETKHKRKQRPRKIKDKYPNLIFTTWDTVDSPRQVIVSDMTALHIRYFYIEVTFYFDVFTKQILTFHEGERRGDRNQYIDGLNDVVSLLEGSEEPTIVHTDQGSVYASMAYNELIRDKNIARSMSRAGKPTDNPVNEALNGWVKEELYVDFQIGRCSTRDEIHDVLAKYVHYYNTERPCWAIGYDIPDRYYERWVKGEIAHQDTFSKRLLTSEPKFLQKRRKKHMEGNDRQK